MKKLLALVLALVMTLSLCVVSSNAKFDDAADISYAEAADVMQAVGVFVGDGSGNFYPTQNLTRAQAAKVIAYLDLGESVAEALPAVQMFSDVPATHWAAKYIAYCADAEIVAGVGNGKFDPEAQVTGYQFAKMLLVVLNYDAEIEKLTGSTWSISCAKLVKENKLAKSFKGSLNDGLTREAAAQLAFNAIKAYPVDAYTGYGLVVGENNTITAGASGKAQKYSTVDKKDNFYVGLYDGKLTTADANDNFENPAHKWVYKNAKVGTYKDTPVLTYTTEWTWAQAKEDLEAAGVQIDTVANNLAKTVTVYENASVYAVLEDTKAPAKQVYNYAAMKENVRDNVKHGGNGIVTNFYADGDDYLKTVTEAGYLLAEVESVSKDLASTKLVNEAALTLKVNLGAKKDSDYDRVVANEDTIGFEDIYADAKKGDMFLVAPDLGFVAADKTYYEVFALGIVAPVVKEGKMTANGTKSCKLDGETYTKAYVTTLEKTNNFAADTDKNVKLYCDEYGYAYGTGEVASASKLVFVTDAYQTLEKGKLVDMISVVYADGTTGELKIAKGNVGENGYKKGNFALYTEGNDGYYTMSKETATEISTKVKAGAVKFDGYYFADDIKTIFCYEGNNKTSVKTVVADGVKEVKASKDAKTSVYYTLNNDNEINAFFVVQKPANTITGTDGIVFIAAKTDTYKTLDKDGSKVTVRAYTAYVDGKEIDEFYAASNNNAVGKFYELEDDVDLENGYLLDTAYHGVEGTDDIIELYGETTAFLLNQKTDVIETVKGETVKVDSNTVFVDVADDNYKVENLNGLIDALRTAGGKADLAVLYDDDGMALYVYVVGFKNN